MSETLAVVDFDRTLFNTAVASEAYAEAVSYEGHMSQGELTEVQDYAQHTGVSFDPFDYVRGLGADQAQLDRITERFYQLVQGRYESDILYDDAMPFMRGLASLAVPTVIMTYGNPEWQQIKLRSVGFDVWPHILTTEKHKGEVIASWLDPETGIYHPREVQNRTLPPYAGHQALRHVVLFDDKAASFRGIPPEAGGYHLQRAGVPVLPSQQGDIPPQVAVVTSLAEINTADLLKAA